MVAREVPDPWASALVKAKLTDPRNGRPSMSRLADEVGTRTSTITSMIFGERSTSGDIIDAAADALGVDRRLVHKWLGRTRSDDTPFRPHPDADLLDPDERRAVNELIRLMAASKKEESIYVDRAAYNPDDDPKKK